jgi:hypothetical protein
VGVVRIREKEAGRSLMNLLNKTEDLNNMTLKAYL